jgi:hypothetical protein
MGRPGSCSPIVSSLNKFEVGGVWTGGGAAASCTQVSTDWNRGISSVAYNAATGKYLVTFLDCGQQILPGSEVKVCRAAAAAPLLVNIVRGTYSATAKTVEIEVWDVDATAALTDLALTDVLLLSFHFSVNKPSP